GTRWQPLFLDPSRGGGAFSSNDGTLATTAPARQALQPYPAITSLATATDPYTTSLISAGGASVLFKALPFLIDPRIMEPL
ncbi:hypothetical protein ABTB34_21500, partial [Acinetobacter baumannii]